MKKTSKRKFVQSLASMVFMIGNLSMIPLSAQAQTRAQYSGGEGGEPFRQSIPFDAVRVLGVYVWGGEYVDAIRFTWKNADGQILEGKRWGGEGGMPCIQLELTENQYIKSISGRYGDHLDSIVIERSDGYKVYCGGRGGDNSFDYTAPSGEEIKSIVGRAGQFLDAIGPVYRELPRSRTPQPSPLTPQRPQPLR